MHYRRSNSALLARIECSVCFGCFFIIIQDQQNSLTHASHIIEIYATITQCVFSCAMNRQRRKILDVKRSIGEMRVIRISLQFAAFMMLMFLVIACTPTKFSPIWKDVTYHGHPERILVINTFPTPGTRRVFEDEIVKALKDRGIEAVVSYPSMSDPLVSDKDVLAQQAKRAGADTVLVNRYVSRAMDDLTPGAIKHINTQTDVYDMKSNRVVFSVSAETSIKQGRPFVPQMETYIRDMINKMSQEGLF